MSNNRIFGTNPNKSGADDLTDLIPSLNIPEFTEKSRHEINGIPVNKQSIKQVREFLLSLPLDSSDQEDELTLKALQNNIDDPLPAIDTGSQALIKNPEQYAYYNALLREQYTNTASSERIISDMRQFLEMLNLEVIGFRLDVTGTLFKALLDNDYDQLYLRTDTEKEKSPFILRDSLIQCKDILSTILKFTAYVRATEKLKIDSGMSDDEINKKLEGFQYRTRGLSAENRDRAESLLPQQEESLDDNNRVILTHKGAFKNFILPHVSVDKILDTDFLDDKYNINNFDSIPFRDKSNQENKDEVKKKWKKIAKGSGKILLWCYAIAGFGDISNFQMLYRKLKGMHPSLAKRLCAYVCFYRYSISDSVILKLLDKDIHVITHENAACQWDPNYGYKVSEAMLPSANDLDYEIQYNVGCLYNTAPDKHTIRIGELGGMAGVSKVQEAYFCGTTRGGIGYGIPDQLEPEKEDNILTFAKELHSQVTGEDITANFKLIETIVDRYGLMMARENSSIINQHPFYDANGEAEESYERKVGEPTYKPDPMQKLAANLLNAQATYQDSFFENNAVFAETNTKRSKDPEFSPELLNITVGNRVLSLILKSMIYKANSEEMPVIITTGNIEGLRHSATFVGLDISDAEEITVEGQKFSIYTARVDDRLGYLVKGFFDNHYIHFIMKNARIPTVFSGEGSLNEGLSYKNAGFMIPFYDFQVTLVLEIGGIKAKTGIHSVNYMVKNVERPNPDSYYIPCQPLKHLQLFDIIKFKFDNGPFQTYLVYKQTEAGFHIKKLDEPHMTFIIYYHEYKDSQLQPNQIFSLDPEVEGDISLGKVAVITYQLQPWAREWMNLIFGRNQQDININKIGDQLSYLLKADEGNNNWFDLLNYKPEWSDNNQEKEDKEENNKDKDDNGQEEPCYCEDGKTAIEIEAMDSCINIHMDVANNNKTETKIKISTKCSAVNKDN